MRTHKPATDAQGKLFVAKSAPQDDGSKVQDDIDQLKRRILLMKVVLGSDHKGIELKKQLEGVLDELGVEWEDLGPFSAERVDYPDYAAAVARQVASGQAQRGIAICASGIGVSIAANKVPGVRAALCTDSYLARMSRLHNDANVLCLGALVVGPALAEDILRTWLATGYEGGRHQARLDKIRILEEGDFAS
jgi:ribose 5-phosphate isomerase B